MIGDIYKDQKVSVYNPSKEVKDFTSYAQRDFQTGMDILRRPWTELGDLSVIDRANRDQRTFNAFVDESRDNPADAWKWRGTRSKARNKAVAMHAQLTASYIFPSFMAQNENDEEDRDFSDLMDSAVEWLGDNSNYKSSYLLATMGILVNPVTYLGAEWREVMMKVKEKAPKGYTLKEVRDEVLSGFNAPVYGPTDILISNAYEQDIQKQRVISKQRWIEYSEAKARYGEHENWGFVQAGQGTVFNSEDERFYDVKDDSHPFMVQEVTYLNRREDTEVCFLGGIYMGDSNPEWNPIKHRDHRGSPKYNVTPFGLRRISEHFYFFSSLMKDFYWDNMLMDAQYELGMNTAFLVSNMPTAVYGSDKIDSDIIFPSSVVAFKDKDTRVEPLLPGLNPGALFTASRETERSMDEASISDTSSGQLPPTGTKATAIAIAERNAKTLLQGAGKTLAESIVQYGSLMADIVVNNLSVPEIMELGDAKEKMKYRTLVLKNKTINGRQSDKIIKFDESLLGMEMTKEDMNRENLGMYEAYDQDENAGHLYRVNPEIFARMKYLTKIEPETMFPQNEEYRQAILSQIQAQFANNPYVSLEALTRKTLHAYFRGEAEDLIQEPQQSPLSGPVPQTTFGQQGQNKATDLSTRLAGMGV